ncbi:MAG: aminoglycoside phosphotransferase family protein [Anaerolineae bacterium]|nr:aminoglycoside phosphotransferase family protein [Anaerolineae bacterium]
MDLDTLLPDVYTYLRNGMLKGIPAWDPTKHFNVAPLAQGEYNLNYTVSQGARTWVLRVNTGSQIQREDQIVYEYQALCLLIPSGVAPHPYAVDDSRQGLPYGALAMSYLRGGRLDYDRDLEDAARLFARIHRLEIPESCGLIAEERPLTMTYEECARLLPVYLNADLADPALCDYLAEVLAWAKEARAREQYFVEDPWPCIINTEVNSGNFIANRQESKLYLVDWEKPLYGDPSQDLSHFCAPMTTLWKTDYRMSPEAKQRFIDTYKATIPDPHLRDTIDQRVRLRDPFNYLRGISWSAMAWVAYQTGDHAVKNADTFRKVTSYLDLAFQREMFDPYLCGEMGV